MSGRVAGRRRRRDRPSHPGTLLRPGLPHLRAAVLDRSHAPLSALRGGAAKGRELSLGQRDWPAPAQQAANTFANQFEIPVLFYVLVGFAMATRNADLLFVVLAWVFVATRFLHAGIYLTTNHVPSRFRAYTAGTLVLLAMWIVFAVRIFQAPAGI